MWLTFAPDRGPQWKVLVGADFLSARRVARAARTGRPGSLGACRWRSLSRGRESHRTAFPVPCGRTRRRVRAWSGGRGCARLSHRAGRRRKLRAEPRRPGPPGRRRTGRPGRAALARAGRSPGPSWTTRSPPPPARCSPTRRRPTGTGHPPRVAVAFGNTPDFVVTYLAALRAGLVAVPVNPALTARELRHVLTDSGAAVLVGAPEVTGRVDRAELPGLRAVHTAPPVRGDAGPAGSRPAPATTSPSCSTPPAPRDGPRARCCRTARSPPTTTRPTGSSRRSVGPDDVVLLALPLFHAYGLNTGARRRGAARRDRGARRRAARPGRWTRSPGTGSRCSSAYRRCS